MADREFETVGFDVPEDASYGDYDITEAGYNVELERIYVLYEGDDLPEGWDQLIFPAERDNGGFRVKGIPPGMMPPAEARESDTPGAVESAKIYDLLEANNITLPD